MNKFFSLVATLALVCTLSACIFNSQPEITYYDLGPGVDFKGKCVMKHPITVLPVKMANTETRISVVNPDGSIGYDNEKRWAQLPSVMIQEYIMKSFASAEPQQPSEAYQKATPYQLKLKVYSFSYDMKSRKADVGIEFTLLDPSDMTSGHPKVLIHSTIVTQSEPQAEDEIDPPAALSKAMETFMISKLGEQMYRVGYDPKQVRPSRR